MAFEAHSLPFYQLFEGIGAGFGIAQHALPMRGAFALFRRIDAKQTDALLATSQGVTVGDGAADRGGLRGGEQEGDDHHGRIIVLIAAKW